MSPEDGETLLATTFRAERPALLAALVAQVRDLGLAEDALQDALAEALVAWRRDGAPRSPAGWLLTAARRRAIDRLRRATVHRDAVTAHAALHELEASLAATDANSGVPDERLRLIFTCCHPALPQPAQVALTLRALCGLETPEIARAFLTNEATMGQRISRAKRKIREAGIPYRVPGERDLDERLESVLDVVYLIFNEGYSATAGDAPVRAELCDEAIRLGRLLHHNMPRPEVCGLLALMLLHDARRAARHDASGALVPLDEQDRRRWDRARIEEGKRVLARGLGRDEAGPFQIQAAIAAVHADASEADATDWMQITALYAALAEYTGSPVVTVNQAVALSHADSPEAGLRLLGSVVGELDAYAPLHAARADLLRRAGRASEAVAAYRRSLELATNVAERRFLSGRLAALSEEEGEEVH